jgi:hypothetical protein
MYHVERVRNAEHILHNSGVYAASEGNLIYQVLFIMFKKNELNYLDL